MPPPQEGLEAHARGLPLLGAIHTTFLPSEVCHLRPRRAVSAPGGVLGNLVDLNVSGCRARQERLARLQSTRKALSLCPLTMAYSWSGALGPRVVPRAAHDVNSCLSRVFRCSLGLGGQDGAARMRFSRPTVLGTLCSRLAASLGGL